MKKTIIAILVVVVALTAMYVTYKREFDQFNPFYKEATVYAVINKPAKPEGKEHIRYRFNLTGYTEQGQKKKVTFSSSKELEQGTYVRLVAKGAYTKKWVLVKKEDVPSGALQ